MTCLLIKCWKCLILCFGLGCILTKMINCIWCFNFRSYSDLKQINKIKPSKPQLIKHTVFCYFSSCHLIVINFNKIALAGLCYLETFEGQSVFPLRKNNPGNRTIIESKHSNRFAMVRTLKETWQSMSDTLIDWKLLCVNINDVLIINDTSAMDNVTRLNVTH